MATVRIMQRDLVKEARWRALLERQAGSGLTIAAWCRRHHLADALFHYWKRTIARRDGGTTPPERATPGVGPRRVSFARVEVQSAASSLKPEAAAQAPGGDRAGVYGPRRRGLRLEGGWSRPKRGGAKN